MVSGKLCRRFAPLYKLQAAVKQGPRNYPDTYTKRNILLRNVSVITRFEYSKHEIYGALGKLTKTIKMNQANTKQTQYKKALPGNGRFVFQVIIVKATRTRFSTLAVRDCLRAVGQVFSPVERSAD